MTFKLHPAAQSAVLLGLFAVIGTGKVAYVHEHTKDQIATNERGKLLHSLQEIMPDSLYDNDILNDTKEVVHELLGDNKPKTVFIARRQGTAVGAVITTVAPDGYNGPIKLLVGITSQGQVAGVRVISHRETPGLGDKIEIARTPWIAEFKGRSLGNPAKGQWAVKRDGGVFDQFTGATITPRAVVAAVRRTLLYFEEHKQELFKKATKTADANE
jgi:electron transport complex protein RnfG